ncbi:hypothetical protein AXG93_108s1010 [Marchantia polymorpha subsp. ruderalis]|uniref:Uncharacterized protein n=1 Tax=Marchantia polymorpha subsp. ruderalis TaxID=1480154 RepID=A0A176VVF3_MARPO|nr:hypothetical protein AXG93_108s1010 [Marchantia polymorpha subsp. ruderalis]
MSCRTERRHRRNEEATSPSLARRHGIQACVAGGALPDHVGRKRIDNGSPQASGRSGTTGSTAGKRMRAIDGAEGEQGREPTGLAIRSDLLLASHVPGGIWKEHNGSKSFESMEGRTDAASGLLRMMMLYAISSALLILSSSISAVHCRTVPSSQILQNLHLRRGAGAGAGAGAVGGGGGGEGGPVDMDASLSVQMSHEIIAGPNSDSTTVSSKGPKIGTAAAEADAEVNRQQRLTFSMLPRGSELPPPGPGLSSNMIASSSSNTPPPVESP